MNGSMTPADIYREAASRTNALLFMAEMEEQ